MVQPREECQHTNIGNLLSASILIIYPSNTNVTYNSESEQGVREILKTTIDNDDTSFNYQEFVFNSLNDLLDMELISAAKQLTDVNALKSKRDAK